MENLDLAKLIYKQGTEFPETFDMHDWATKTECGTAACLAGHAMLLSGYSVRVYPSKVPWTEWSSVFYRPDGTEVYDVVEESLDLLGMSGDEYERVSEDGLFYLSSNSAALTELKYLIDAEEARRRRAA